MTQPLSIIGLSGTNGSGKDAIGLLLAENHGYLFISVTELLRDELKRRGVPIEREHLRALSAEWRREHGYGVLVDRAVELFRETAANYKGLALASLRNPSEADRVHELNGKVWWIDADPKLRYSRIQANAHLRGRAEEDTKTYPQFLAEEEAEMHTTGDAATLNMAAVRDKSDVTLQNDSNDLSVLESQIARLL